LSGTQTIAKSKAGEPVRRGTQKRRDETRGTEYYRRREDEASKNREGKIAQQPPWCLPCTSSSSSSTTLSLLTACSSRW
jgi:hypothetical protein